VADKIAGINLIFGNVHDCRVSAHHVLIDDCD